MPEHVPKKEPEEKLRKLTIELTPKLLKAPRLAAVEQDTSVRAVVTDLIERYLSRRKTS